ncbi:MAG TPA: hypothetical protein VHZ03_22405 [Trebonia sp.]|jgi:hypothetical protein|nr:hypothetical protein [Trebonia sp.]
MTACRTTPPTTIQPYRFARGGAAEYRSPIASASDVAEMNQAMSAWNCVTPVSDSWNRGTVE